MRYIPLDIWNPADGLTLEPTALEVVKCTDRHNAVIAGPGAGKTELLAQRAAFLLQTGACRPPHRILALCFKREAVRTLRERVSRRCGPDLAARFDCMTFHAFAKGVLDRHWRVLPEKDQPTPGYRIVGKAGDGKQTLTYGQMFQLGQAIVKMSTPLQRAYRLTYRFVLLDEFQDCTADQFALVNNLFPKSDCPAILTAVGDPGQRIMGFAGALPSALSDFLDAYDAEEKPLLSNYRCAQGIRRLLHEMRYLDEVPWSEVSNPDGVDVRACVFQSAAHEAIAVLGAVQRWRSEGTALEEIAILTRLKSGRTNEVIQELQAQGIPVLEESERQNELNQPLGRAVLCLWWILTHTDDHPSNAWNELRDALWSAQDAWGDEQAEHRLTRQLSTFIRVIRAKVNLSDSTMMKEAAERALTKLFRIEEVASRWSPSESGGWTDDFRVVADAYTEMTAKTNDPRLAVEHLLGIGAIRLMNVHKCKGMEFERVIVLGIEGMSFFGEDESIANELFVACSRAKKSLRLTRQTAIHSRRTNSGIRWFDERLDRSGFPFIPCP